MVLRLLTGRYELELWELFFIMHYPSQLEQKRNEGFVSRVQLWEGEHQVGVREERLRPLREALRQWDCRWYSPPVMINSGYCWDVLGHMVGQNNGLLWRIGAKAWIGFLHAFLFPSKMDIMRHMSKFHREICEKTLCVCWHERSWPVPVCAWYIQKQFLLVIESEQGFKLLQNRFKHSAVWMV